MEIGVERETVGTLDVEPVPAGEVGFLLNF
jgi:hypothetical protein